MRKWKKAMIAPSNSVSFPFVIVIGEKDFQRIVSAIFAAMKIEIPELSPYPFWHNSSSNSTSTPAKNSWATMRIELTSPS
jgi:hypothetical protein